MAPVKQAKHKLRVIRHCIVHLNRFTRGVEVDIYGCLDNSVERFAIYETVQFHVISVRRTAKFLWCIIHCFFLFCCLFLLPVR